MDVDGSTWSLKSYLRSVMPRHRYLHSIGAGLTARCIAELYGADPAKCMVAGLLHDIARDMGSEELLKKAANFSILVSKVEAAQPVLLHGPVGAEVAKRAFGIDDPEVLNAVRVHTTGLPGMGLVEKVVFVADYVEPFREFEGVEGLRRLAFIDIDSALLKSIELTLDYLVRSRRPIDARMVETRNWLLDIGPHRHSLGDTVV